MRDHRLWQQAWAVYRGAGMALGDIPHAALLALLADEEQAKLEAERLAAYRQLEEGLTRGIAGDVG